MDMDGVPSQPPVVEWLLVRFTTAARLFTLQRVVTLFKNYLLLTDST